jgi:PhzF family phenazine biosynthesis protein
MTNANRKFVVNAFATQSLRGNLASVYPLQVWPEDAQMLAIAADNKFSETAFFVPEGDSFRLRWFTPVTEVKLCGYATLATAHGLHEIQIIL